MNVVEANLAVCVRRAAARLAALHDQLTGAECRYEAEVLLGHVLGRDRAWLFAHADASLDVEQRQWFEALIERRGIGEPVAHLTGRRGFWSLDLEVTADTLIPRPETETLVACALRLLPLRRVCRVLDLGTGSGAIALAVACERPNWTMHATDVSEAALAVAQRNAAHAGINRVVFHCGDWFAPVAGERFDAVLSNPPYIEAGDAHLRAGDLRFEPLSALASGVDGLDAIRRIIADAPDHLLPGGWLLLEHGPRQCQAVRVLLSDRGLVDVTTERDLEAR